MSTAPYLYSVHTLSRTRYAVIGTIYSPVSGRVLTTKTVSVHPTMADATADALARNYA